VDWVHGWWTTAESHGPPWTGGKADRSVLGHGGMLVRAGPPTTLGCRSSLEGVGNGERRMGLPFQASPGLG
jgi:hypothetical protein